jgi:hypothetical protein
MIRAKKRRSGCPLGLIGKLQKEIGCFRGMGRGADDGAAVILQDGQPIADVIGMADGRHDPKAGAQEGAAKFGHQFLAGISLVAKAPGEVTREARLVA